MNAPNEEKIDHAPALNEAMTDVPGPEELGICGDCLKGATDQVIKEQLESAISEENLAEIRKMMAEAGEHNPDPDVVRTVAIRSHIGGTFTYGIGVGLKLAAARAR